MPDRPPPLDNGFAWIAHTLLPLAKARILERRLGDILHHVRTRDVSELGGPEDIEVELWAHPDDQHRAAIILHEFLAE